MGTLFCSFASTWYTHTSSSTGRESIRLFPPGSLPRFLLIEFFQNLTYMYLQAPQRLVRQPQRCVELLVLGQAPRQETSPGGSNADANLSEPVE